MTEAGTGSSSGIDFDRHADRLRRTIRLRLDRRLVGVIDSAYVLDRVRAEATRREPERAGSDQNGPFLWLRRLTGEVLREIHLEELGEVGRGDVTLLRGALPEASSASLATQLLGKGAGAAGDHEAARANLKLQLQELLNAMDPMDREALTLRHCEQLSSDEAAAVLGISIPQASEAYIRALRRIGAILTPQSIKRGGRP